jgi:zinc transporter ZupT
VTHAALVGVAAGAALVTLTAGLLPLFGLGGSGRRLHFFLGVTAGLLLTSAFVNLIPVALAADGEVGWTIALGFLALYGVEWAVGVHGHGGGEGATVGAADTHFQRAAPALPVVAFTALAVHRAIDGLTLPAAFQVGRAPGLMAGGAVLIHQFPDGFAASVLFLAGGWSRRRIVASLVALAISTPLGTLLGSALVTVPGWVPHLMGLAGVTFVFIAVAELMPELHHGPHKWMVGFGLLIGYALAYVIAGVGGN